MLRLLIVVSVLEAFIAAPAHGQSLCNDSELAFVGRAEAPVTLRYSPEAEIEQARQNAVRAEADFERMKTSNPNWMSDPRLKDLTIRMVEAQQELRKRQAMYTQPFELTFSPVHIVRPFRGVSEATVMVLARDIPPLQPGEEYLIYGARSTRFIPPWPGLGDLTNLANYVEPHHVNPVALVQRQLSFLASTMSGAMVMGTLRMRAYGGVGAPLGGVRVLVSSGTQVVETTTRDDGGFVASGLRPGEIEIKPALNAGLTVVNPKNQTTTVREGGCALVDLYVGVNGRVRGRIVGGSGASLESMQLNLQTTRDDRRSIRSHDVRIETRPSADGSFELIGVPPGSYLLSAWILKPDGRTTVTTYYPGTDDINAATPIVVGQGTQHDGFDFIVRTE